MSSRQSPWTADIVHEQQTLSMSRRNCPWTAESVHELMTPSKGPRYSLWATDNILGYRRCTVITDIVSYLRLKNSIRGIQILSIRQRYCLWARNTVHGVQILSTSICLSARTLSRKQRECLGATDSLPAGLQEPWTSFAPLATSSRHSLGLRAGRWGFRVLYGVSGAVLLGQPWRRHLLQEENVGCWRWGFSFTVIVQLL